MERKHSCVCSSIVFARSVEDFSTPKYSSSFLRNKLKRLLPYNKDLRSYTTHQELDRFPQKQSLYISAWFKPFSLDYVHFRFPHNTHLWYWYPFESFFWQLLFEHVTGRIVYNNVCNKCHGSLLREKYFNCGCGLFTKTFDGSDTYWTYFNR